MTVSVLLGRGAEACETLQKGLAEVPGEIRERATGPGLGVMVTSKLDGLEKAERDLLLFSLTKRMVEQCRERRSAAKCWQKLGSL